MTNWTPGPWKSTGYLVKTEDGVDICYSCCPPNNVQANSLLIAAAPEMYEMLEGVSEYLKSVGVEDGLWVKEIKSVLDKAR